MAKKTNNGKKGVLNGKKGGLIKAPRLDIKSDRPQVYDIIQKKYPNQYELNKVIEAFITEKGGASGHYTSDEKFWIKKYSGYGGLSKFGTAGKGAFFEYYTPQKLIKKMWGLAYKHGYGGGPLLEPALGTGEYLQYAPEGADITAYEISEHSATIAKILYPHANIIIQPFEKTFIENNYTVKDRVEPKYDLVIGNPPYGGFDIVKSRYFEMGEMKHVKPKNWAEYFIRRSVDLLKPKGLLVFVVGALIEGGGRLFLDTGDSHVKKYLFDNTYLSESYLLPNGVFERTEVTSEIIVLKKK